MIDTISTDKILITICRVLNISVKKLLTGERTDELVEGRVIYAIIRKSQKISLQQITSELGKANHTTAMNWLSNHEDWLTNDADYIRKLVMVCSKLGIKISDLQRHRASSSSKVNEKQAILDSLNCIDFLLQDLKEKLNES